MDNRLCVNPSTNRTLEIEGRLPFPMVPEPMILPFWLPPNFTSPSGLSSSLWNIDLLPVICREHLESRYHDWCFNFTVKDIYNINYFFFRYPYLSGSFLVRVSKVLFEPWFNIKSFRTRSVFYIMCVTITELFVKWFVCDSHFINRFGLICFFQSGGFISYSLSIVPTNS